MTYRSQVFALLDRDASLTLSELTRRVGCSRATVKESRRAWLRGEQPRRGRDDNRVSCQRCEILSDAENPVENGLCLWCRLEQAGVSLRHFYESGQAAACGLPALKEASR